MLKLAPLTLAALAWTGAACADPIKDTADAVALGAVLGRAGAGTLDRPVSAFSGVEVRAGQADGAVSIKASHKISGQAALPGVAQYLGFTASAPLAKGEESATLGGLDGLGDATSFEVKYTHVRLFGAHAPTLGGPDGLANAEAEAGRICRVALAGYRAKVGKDPEDFDCRPAALAIDMAAVKAYAPAELDSFKALFFDADAKVVLFGFTGKVATQKFDYLDVVSLAEAETHETPWSMGAYLAVEPLRWKTLFTFRAEHVRADEAPDSEIRCPTGAVACVEGAVGPPKKSDKQLASLEVRRRFGRVGVALTGSYDLKDGDYGFDLPVYFIVDAKQGVSGGLRATWDSDRHDLAVGLFVAKAFTYFGDLD